MSANRQEPRWVSRSIVLAIHADQNRQHGGTLGLRDLGLLESALQRAPNHFHYETTADLCTLAALYGVGLAKNHAFVDGNKRAAFQAMYVFLGLNGIRIVADEPEVIALMLGVASGERGEKELAEWLSTHSHPR